MSECLCVGQSQLETQADKEKTKESEPNGISLSGYRGYLREFDMDVFTILHTGLITRAALDTEMNTKVRTQPSNWGQRSMWAKYLTST